MLKEIFPPWPGQRDFPLFPNVLLHNLAAGTTSVLPALPWADLAAFSPARIARQLLTQAVETLTGNVFYFQRLLPVLQEQPGGFPLVRAVGIGGSPVPEWLPHALQIVFPNATIYLIYGSSEAEPIAVRPVTGAGQNPTQNPAQNPALGYAVGPVHPSLELHLEPLGLPRSAQSAASHRGRNMGARPPRSRPQRLAAHRRLRLPRCLPNPIPSPAGWAMRLCAKVISTIKLSMCCNTYPG